MVDITVLGSVNSRSERSQSEKLAPGVRQLLAIIVAAGPAGLSFERVADELWPADLPPTWDPSLRMALTRLRRHLPKNSLTSRGGWCRLELEPSEVDSWYLSELATAPLDGVEGDRVINMLGKEAFPGVEVGPLLRAAINQFDLLRITLVDRLIEEEIPISAIAAAGLRSFAETREWDAQLLARAEELVSMTAGVAPWLHRSVGTALPRSLARHRSTVLTGRTALVDELYRSVASGDHPAVTLEASPRSGRTTVLAALGARLVEQGWRIVHLEATTHQAAYGPFLQALPELRAPILQLLASGRDERRVRSGCWTTILQALDAPSLPTCLMVDGCEQLDSSSERALQFLSGSTTTHPLVLVVCANPGPDGFASSGWADAPAHTVPPLDAANIADLMRDRLDPNAGIDVSAISDEILAASGGLAAEAHRLVELVDTDTLSLPPAAQNIRATAPFDGLSMSARRVAAGASIIGSPISLIDLERVTGQPGHLVLTSVDELLGSGVLVEVTPDRFTIDVRHRATDFIRWIHPEELQELHRRALVLPSLDSIARASHARSAGPLLPSDEVARLQLAAATDLAQLGRYAEAVIHFRNAEELNAELNAEQLLSYANATSRAGGDSLALRERMVAQAIERQQHSLALAAVISEAREPAPLDGDARWAELLRSIDPAFLNQDEQLKRHLQLSRHLLFSADRNAAEAEVAKASELVRTVDQAADVWFATAHVDGWQPVGDGAGGFRARQFDRIAEVVDASRLARIHEAVAVSSLIAGDYGTAASAVEHMTRAANDSADPRRIWFAGILRTTLANNSLDFAEADATADATRDHGVAHGLSDVVATRLAQASNQAALFGVGEQALARIDASLPKAQESLLARAGKSRVLARTGRVREALASAEDILADAAGSRFELAIHGLLSGVVQLRSPALAKSIRAGLEPHLGQALVIGAGVSSIGPVEGLLARVTESREHAMALRREAVQRADCWESPLWQIMTRIELSNALSAVDAETEAGQWRREAASRAEGTEFAVRERWGLFHS